MSSKSNPDPVALLLQGILDHKIEIVAEAKLQGHPFAEVNSAPPSLKDTFFSVYCHDPKLADQLIKENVVSRQRSTDFSPLPDGGIVAKYKLHGELEKQMIAGYPLREQNQIITLSRSEKGEFELLRIPTENGRKAIRITKISTRAFGPDRLFAPIPPRQSATMDLALAKAEKKNGMDDLLIVRNARDRDSVFDLLREVGLYRTGDPRFVAPNVKGEGQVSAIYIPASVAESIRNTLENDILDFQFESPDVAALSDEINHRMETSDEVVAFTEGRAPAKFVCELAAHHWPLSPDQTMDSIALGQPNQPTQKAPVIWSKPAKYVMQERALTPAHYTIIKTAQSDGKYNYRIQVNANASNPPKSYADLWAFGEPSLCNEPVSLERANIKYCPQRRQIAPDTEDESIAKNEITRLEKALGGAIATIEVPFNLQEKALSSRSTTIAIKAGPKHDAEMAIDHVWMGQAGTGNKAEHYLFLQAPHLARLSDKFIGSLGFRKGTKIIPLSDLGEKPALIAIPLPASVAENIDRQFKAKPERLLSGEYAKLPPEDSFEALCATTRSRAGIQKLTPKTETPVLIQRGTSEPKAKTAEEAADPLAGVMKIINHYSLGQMVLHAYSETDPQTGESHPHYCLTITHQKDNHNFNRLQQELSKLYDDDSDHLVEDADMCQADGHDNRQRLFQIHDLPEELVDALQSGARPLEAQSATDSDSQALIVLARSHFRDQRERKRQEPEKISPAERIAGKSLYQLDVRYPDLQEWAHYRANCESLMVQAEQWQKTPAPDQAFRQQAATLRDTMLKISPASQVLFMGAYELENGAQAIARGREAISNAHATLDAEEQWMAQHLNADRTLPALVIRDIGKRDLPVIETLLGQGKITSAPVFVHYKKHRDSKKRERTMNAQACILYPTKAFADEIAASRKKLNVPATEIPAFNLLPEWQEGQVQEGATQTPTIPVGKIPELISNHFDVQSLRQREEDLARPTKVIGEVAQHILKSMTSQALLVRERQENLVDGKRQHGVRPSQGVGVADDERGSQLVLVTRLDSRNVKEFMRQIWGPLEQEKLLAGQKVYEPKIIHRPLKLSQDEQQVLQLQKTASDISSWLAETDLTYKVSEGARAQIAANPDRFSELKQEMRLPIRMFERQQEHDPATYAALVAWAKHPTPTDASLMWSTAMMFGALLHQHGISNDTNLDPTTYIRGLARARGHLVDYQQQIKNQVGEQQEKAGRYGAIKTHDSVVKTSIQDVALFDLDGKAIQQSEIEAAVQGKSLIVKCYFSSEAEQLSKQIEGNPLRKTKDLLRAGLEAQGRRDVALEPAADAPAIVGKHTGRIATEADLIRRTRTATTGDNAMRAGELKEIMTHYFSEKRGVSAA